MALTETGIRIIAPLAVGWMLTFIIGVPLIVVNDITHSEWPVREVFATIFTIWFIAAIVVGIIFDADRAAIHAAKKERHSR